MIFVHILFILYLVFSRSSDSTYKAVWLTWKADWKEDATLMLQVHPLFQACKFNRIFSILQWIRVSVLFVW